MTEQTRWKPRSWVRRWAFVLAVVLGGMAVLIYSLLEAGGFGEDFYQVLFFVTVFGLLFLACNWYAKWTSRGGALDWVLEALTALEDADRERAEKLLIRAERIMGKRSSMWLPLKQWVETGEEVPVGHLRQVRSDVMKLKHQMAERIKRVWRISLVGFVIIVLLRLVLRFIRSAFQ